MISRNPDSQPIDPGDQTYSNSQGYRSQHSSSAFSASIPPADDLSSTHFQSYLANIRGGSSLRGPGPPPHVPHAANQPHFDYLHLSTEPIASAPVVPSRAPASHGTTFAPAHESYAMYGYPPARSGATPFAGDPTTMTQVPHAADQYPHASTLQTMAPPVPPHVSHGTYGYPPATIDRPSETFTEDSTTVIHPHTADQSYYEHLQAFTQQAIAPPVPPPHPHVSHGTYSYSPARSGGAALFAGDPTTATQALHTAGDVLHSPIHPIQPPSTTPVAFLMIGPLNITPGQPLNISPEDIARAPARPVNITFNYLPDNNPPPPGVNPPTIAPPHPHSGHPGRSFTTSHAGSVPARTPTRVVSSARISPYPSRAPSVSAGSSQQSLSSISLTGDISESQEGLGIGDPQISSRKGSRGDSRGRASLAGSRGRASKAGSRGRASKAGSRGRAPKAGSQAGSPLATTGSTSQREAQSTTLLAPTLFADLSTNVMALLEEMRYQVCLISTLHGPPFPNAAEKGQLYKDAQLRARLRCRAIGGSLIHIKGFYIR